MGAGAADTAAERESLRPREPALNKIQATQLAFYILPGIQVLSSDKGTPES